MPHSGVVVVHHFLYSAEKMKNIITKNRKAYYNYTIEETLEVGICLMGSEVKSLRESNGNIQDSHAGLSGNELFVHNLYIAEYKGANRFNHQPRRVRKLLLHKREIKKLIGSTKVKGYTLIPLSLYFNDKNMIKMEIGIAKGKKNYDKRAAEKDKEWSRSKARNFKEI